MVLLKDKWCSSERNRCYTKQDKANTETVRRYLQGGTTKKSTESHWRSIKFAKRKSCFSIASLLKDTTIRLRELSGCRTPNIGFFVWMLMGLKSLFHSDQNLPLHENKALKCKTLTWRKRNNLWDRYVQNINNVNEKINNSKEEKTSITMSIGKLDGGTTESRQSAQSLQQSHTWSKNCPKIRKLQGDLLQKIRRNKKFLFNLLIAEVQANDERRETCCKNMSENSKNYQRTRSYPNCAPKQAWVWSRLDNTSILFRHQEERKSIFMSRKYDASRSRRNSYQRVDPKQYTIRPSLGHKTLQSQRKIQCWSSGSIFVSRSNRILDSNCERYWQNLSEKPCRSKRKRKLRGNPLQKRDQYLKPSSTSGWGFILIGQRKWIDIVTQESNDPCCFQVSKFITRLLRHSKKVHREDDGAVQYDPVMDECKEKQFDNTEYWSVEMEKDLVNAPHWSIEKWMSVLAKGGGQKKRFQYCLNPNYPFQFL